MNTKQFPPEIRFLMQKALPKDVVSKDDQVPLEVVYLPQSHIKALRPTSSLVVGIRGSGKSFWWNTLQDPHYLAIYGDELGLSERDKVSVGFGETPHPDTYPSRDLIENLIRVQKPHLIWKTIIFKQLIDSWHTFLNFESTIEQFVHLKEWKDRVLWITDETHLALIDRILYQIDQYLDQKKAYHIILFDALDRAADEWHNLNALARGILQNALDFLSYKRIRIKIFVRPDQIEDAETRNFPDASKLLSQKTELIWPREELYALLWHYLANISEGSEMFRQTTEGWYKVQWAKKETIWIVPDQLRREQESYQRELFHALAGPQMGLDTRRGYPYTWLINHLGDTRKQVSPRSFLTALRVASEIPERPQYPYPIHYEAIKKGVQEASKIRVREIEEDYPWVKDLFDPLKNLVVPCSIKEIEIAWKNHDTLNKLGEKISTQEVEVKLPPRHLQDGVDGVLQDLKELGLVDILSDGRINIPDVYRVGYGMGRRGGIKPAAR